MEAPRPDRLRWVEVRADAVEASACTWLWCATHDDLGEAVDELGADECRDPARRRSPPRRRIAPAWMFDSSHILGHVEEHAAYAVGASAAVTIL